MKITIRNLSLLMILLFSIYSCNAQKMMRTINDAKKLQINKNEFVGKPFSKLLGQIKPEIKFAYGTPGNKELVAGIGTLIKIYFTTIRKLKK